MVYRALGFVGVGVFGTWGLGLWGFGGCCTVDDVNPAYSSLWVMQDVCILNP